VHTTCSDGWVPPEKIPGLAARKGLDIVAVTDHDNVKGGLLAEKARQDGEPFVIPGIEVTLPGAHVLGYFVRKRIKSRSLPGVIGEIKGHGGIAVWAHPVHYPILGPLRGKKPSIPKAEELFLFDAIEVYNGRNSRQSNQEILEICRGNGISALTAGSDAHFSFELGMAKTIFELEKLDELSIKAAFDLGRVSVMKDQKGCRICYFVTGILNTITRKIY